MRSYNPEQIMLSAAVRRASRDVNIMKEKLIFSGKVRRMARVKSSTRVCFSCPHVFVVVRLWSQYNLTRLPVLSLC